MRIPLTIITVVRNKRDKIEATIQSITPFRRNGVRYILIDGASTDGTMEIVNRFAKDIDIVLSEPDLGVYNAMNKGWRLADANDYILFIAAGDKVISLEDKYWTDGRDMDPHTVLLCKVQMEEGYYFTHKVDWRLRIRNTLHHQGLLIKKQLFDDPPFNEKYRVYGDFDLNQRLSKKKCEFFYLKGIVTFTENAGISGSLDLNEQVAIVYRNYGAIWATISLFHGVYYLIRCRFKRIVHWIVRNCEQ